MIAHDLRGALQGVVGGVAMLDQADVAPPVREQLNRIAAASQALAGLIDCLIDADHAPRPADRAPPVDLQRFLAHLGRRWIGEAQERGVAFRVQPGFDLPATLDVPQVALGRALGNLIGNALRHAGGGEVRLAARRLDSGGVAFEVIDEGPGVPAAVADRVLRPGPRPSAPSADGHGLGLYIARDLCAEMGGALTLANRPGGGAVATVSLPAAPGRPVDGGAAAAPAEGRKRLDLGGLHILLAEDNLTNQMVATQMLRALNAEVTLSSDGVEALERFESGEFDLVVVDIEMPRMTGLDVIRAIRSRSDGRAGVPIVALTAYAMREHRDQIAAAGANGLISKPITSVEALGLALLAHVTPSEPPAPPAAAPVVPPQAADSGEPVADMEVFDALCAAIGSGMMAELLDKVVADLAQARDDLAGALSPLDRRPIRSASHILISVAGAIGAVRLQSCARSLNQVAHGEDGRSLPGDVRRCIDEIDAAIAFARSRRPAS